MNESLYRRLCMTSVCGAIIIPAAMALVSRSAFDTAPGGAVVASAASTMADVAATTPRPGIAGNADTSVNAARTPSPDRIAR